MSTADLNACVYLDSICWFNLTFILGQVCTPCRNLLISNDFTSIDLLFCENSAFLNSVLRNGSSAPNVHPVLAVNLAASKTEAIVGYAENGSQQAKKDAFKKGVDHVEFESAYHGRLSFS